MPKGMVVKAQPPVRDRHNKRILIYKVGDFTDATYKKLLKGGQIAPAGDSPKPTKAAKSGGEGQDGAETDTDQANAGSGTQPAGDTSGSGSGTSL